LLVVEVSPPGAPLFDEVVVEDSEDFSDADGADGAPWAPVAPEEPVAPVAPDSPGAPRSHPMAAVLSRNAIPINAAMAPVFFFRMTIFLIRES